MFYLYYCSRHHVCLTWYQSHDEWPVFPEQLIWVALNSAGLVFITWRTPACLPEAAYLISEGNAQVPEIVVTPAILRAAQSWALLWHWFPGSASAWPDCTISVFIQGGIALSDCQRLRPHESLIMNAHKRWCVSDFELILNAPERWIICPDANLQHVALRNIQVHSPGIIEIPRINFTPKRPRFSCGLMCISGSRVCS